MSNLRITVEAYAGSDIPAAIYEMVQLAWRLGVDVHASMNGVTVMAKPGADPQLLTEAWHKELMKPGGQYKIACVHPIEKKSTAGRVPERKS